MRSGEQFNIPARNKRRIKHAGVREDSAAQCSVTQRPGWAWTRGGNGDQAPWIWLERAGGDVRFLCTVERWEAREQVSLMALVTSNSPFLLCEVQDPALSPALPPLRFTDKCRKSLKY